jgi:protoporphyrinogen IX oxidase
MTDWLQLHYQGIMALHVIAVMSWMAGMLYLPRLYAYHAEAEKGSDKSETFKIMEKRLLRLIINPAMIAAFLFGGLMLAARPELLHGGWLHVKLTCVVLLTAAHGLFARWRKVFERDGNTRPAKFYKIWNEVPAVLMVIIVIMVIVKPF